MSVTDTIKSQLGNLLRSGKTETALRLSASLMLVFLLARTGADLTWQLGASLMSKGRSAGPGWVTGQISPTTTSAFQNRPAPPAEEIALFGQAVADLSAPGEIETAPVSTLNLMLKGIVAVRPMRRALAVIAERGGAGEKLYSQGEEISANVVIKEIHPDRVIISRGAILETLFLEGFQKPASTQNSPATGTAARAAGDYIQPRGDGINWQIKQNYWEEKLADIPGLAREVGVEVYSENSQQKGYRLIAIQNSKLLNSLGLLPGDILLSVNGRPMNNIQEGLAAYQQIKSGGQVTVEINRSGRRESRVYNIGG